MKIYKYRILQQCQGVMDFLTPSHGPLGVQELKEHLPHLALGAQAL